MKFGLNKNKGVALLPEADAACLPGTGLLADAGMIAALRAGEIRLHIR